MMGANVRAAEEQEVSATEDLMREHGVIRRALLVYDQISGRLKAGDAGFDVRALGDTAQLFRDFGEDYHERMLEEAFIFPRVKQKGGRAGQMADVLRNQHERGREITDYVLALAGSGQIGAANVQPLAAALRTLVAMYEAHAAREDTIVFPAWKAALSDAEYKDVGEQFEDIEKKVFGGDGFDQAEAKISQIELRLGLADLDRFTAPPPPQVETAP